MLLVFFLILRVTKNIVDEDDDKLIQILTENSVYEVHKCCEGVYWSKWHYCELIMAIS